MRNRAIYFEIMNRTGGLLGLILMLLLVGCGNTEKQEEQPSVRLISFSDLEQEISKPSGQLKVINFWATWCKPCIEEMPYFDEIAKQQGDVVTLYFVSMDFKEDLARVSSFVEKKKPLGRVMLLDDIKYDSWMPKVDSTWSGAIPATLFVDPAGNQYFYEKSFTQNELSDLISSLL